MESDGGTGQPLPRRNEGTEGSIPWVSPFLRSSVVKIVPFSPSFSVSVVTVFVVMISRSLP
jgi:hypothetical protein